MTSFESRCAGALMGTALGDAFGCPFEGAVSEPSLRARLEKRANAPGPWGYTDDTQMMIGVAEGLLNGFSPQRMEPLIEALVQNYDPARGYGKGMKIVVDAYLAGAEWREARFKPWSEGSRGNGAAVRVVPVACVFPPEHPELIPTAAASAAATHAHSDAIDGAILYSLTVSRVLATPPDALGFAPALLEFLGQQTYSDGSWVPSQLDTIRELLTTPPSTAALIAQRLGNNTLASGSVSAAIYAFLHSAPDFRSTLIDSAAIGGDVDTIAAMAGGLAGALVGIEAVPDQWLANLENGAKGRDYIMKLARGISLMAARYRPTAT